MLCVQVATLALGPHGGPQPASDDDKQKKIKAE